MRDHGSGEFRRGQHAGFDVHMPVTKAGDQELPSGVDKRGLRPDAMRCIWPDIGKSALSYRHLPSWQNLSALDVDQRAANNNKISRRATGADNNKTGAQSAQESKGACFVEAVDRANAPHSSSISTNSLLVWVAG
jgi:hypothetical protein